MKTTVRDDFGSRYTIRVKKTEGYYKNKKTGEIQYLHEPCKGWKQLTQYGRDL